MASMIIGGIHPMTVGGIFTAQARQSIQLRFNGGQLAAYSERKESLCGTLLPVVRADLAPAAQQTIFVARLGTEIAQTLAKVCDTHRGVRSGNQSGFENNCGEAVRILTQASPVYGAVSREKCFTWAEQGRNETVVSPQLFTAFGCHNLLDFSLISHIG
jgi:hypothetical protein